MAMNLYQYRFSNREGLIVQIGDGWGEIAPLPGFSKETLEEAKNEMLDYFNRGTAPTLPSVRWGLICAGKSYDPSPLSVSLCAFKKPFHGCTHLKLKLGALTLEEGIALVQSYVGKYLLRIDCNRAWTLEQALTFAENFEASDFDYFEEPVKSFADLVEFSKRTNFPIAIDESLREGLPYKEIPSVVAAVVKPMMMGGIPQLDLPIVLSSSFETSLGILHIARAASPTIPQGLHTFADDLLTPPLQAHSGKLHASQHNIDIGKLCLIASRN